MQATHAAWPGTQAPLPAAEAALIGLVVLAVVIVPFLWPLGEPVRHHGARGRMPSSHPFWVHRARRDAGPQLRWGDLVPRSWRAKSLLVAFAGCLGPSGFGLGAAKLIETGHGACVPPIAIVLLVLLLFLDRRSFGAVRFHAIALLAVAIRYAHDGLEDVIVYAMDLATAAVRRPQRRGPQCAAPGMRATSAGLPAYPVALGGAVDRGHARGLPPAEMASPAILT